MDIPPIHIDYETLLQLYKKQKQQQIGDYLLHIDTLG